MKVNRLKKEDRSKKSEGRGKKQEARSKIGIEES